MAVHAANASASMCQTFDRLAQKVWTRLDNASRFRMSYGEESITDEILLDLAMSHPRDVAITKFSKAVEGTRTGADWEWWFGDRGAWFGMRVQAKVLHPIARRYLSLDHRVRKSKKFQVDLLLQDARKRKLFPLYCLYNYWDVTAVPFHWPCSGRAPQQHQWGCSLVDGYKVKALVGSQVNDLVSVNAHAVPWTCLPCCRREVETGPLGLAGRARAVALMLDLTVESGRRPLVPSLISQPPQYVRQLLERQGRGREPGLLDGVDERSATSDGWPIDSVDGVLVVRDLDLRTPLDSSPTKRQHRRRSRKG